MYTRIKTSPNSPKKAVQIVESCRIGKQVRQRIVRHVGTALDDTELQQLKDLAEYIIARLENERQPVLFAPETLAQMAIQARARNQTQKDEPLSVDLKQLREEQRVITGIHEVYGAIYQELGFQQAFSNPARQVAASKNLYHLVMARIANPSSKRASVDQLAAGFGIELSLSAVYRMMDKIDADVIANITQRSYQAAASLLRQDINVIFYDCTTLYFESFSEDDLKQNGYSKDLKFNQPQVLVALLITTEGLPIGYEVFPGSTFEGDTLRTALAQLEQQYRIGRIIFVADSALLSKANLALLERSGYKYIVSARLKNLAKVWQDQVLDQTLYRPLTQEEDQATVCELAYENGRRLIVTWSRKRAEKDRCDRQKAVEKLERKLRQSQNPAALISNYGYRRFLKLSQDVTVNVDEGKIAVAAAWDGLHGVITNLPVGSHAGEAAALSAEEIIRHYHGLWQIEHCFRISKHDLRIRPIFHWTSRRVRAHLAICFMALVCVRHLTYRVAHQYQALSAAQIRNHLSGIQMSILRHQQNGDRYALPSSFTSEAKKIYQAVGKKLNAVPFKIAP